MAEARGHFHKLLDELYEKTLFMGEAVSKQIEDSFAALSSRDEELASRVIQADAEIDDQLFAIEDSAAHLIAMQQPVAGELREIITTIKIAAHLERIGDHARHFSRAVTDVPQAVLEEAIGQMREMAQMGVAMIRDALAAFAEHDSEQAIAVSHRDDQIDAAHRLLYRKLVDLMKGTPAEMDAIVNMMFLNRFLERLGDHVTNICEWVVFANSGEHPKLNP